MEFLSTLEELGIEKGQQIVKQIGAKENSELSYIEVLGYHKLTKQERLYFEDFFVLL
jgi:hypothetical protein